MKGVAVPVALAVAIAGMLGALARYGLDSAVSSRTSSAFPWGILVVNVSGALALGFAFVVLTHAGIAPWIRSGVTIGFLGAYTTFSTLSLDTYRLLEERAYGAALANSVGSLALGLAAVTVGIAAGRFIT